jgi:FdhD protein
VRESVAREAPLTLYVDGEELVTLLCTPTRLEELVVGYLASEGVLTGVDEVRWLAVDPARGEAWIVTRDGRGRGLAARFARRVFDACCGKGRPGLFWQADLANVRPLGRRGPRLTAAAVRAAMAALRAAAADDVFGRTGGVHDACLTDARGAIIAHRSDIGRHNALDKLHGLALMRGLDTASLAIAVSGRISSEVLLKAARMGVAVLISKAAPTDLAVDLARRLGMTAVGFVRDGRLSVYSGSWRILEGAGQEPPRVAANPLGASDPGPDDDERRGRRARRARRPTQGEG